MARFPAYAAGMRVTAALLASSQPDIYQKGAATQRPSTTTLADDPDLQLPLGTNGVYLCEFYIKYATVKAAGFQTQWNVPGTFTGANRQVEGLAASSATVAAQDATPDSTNFSTRKGTHGFTTSIGYGSRNSVALQLWAYEWAIITTAASVGTVALRWAQMVSTVDLTQVVAQSFARSTQIG